jgi:hypothetical protein
MSHSQSAAKVSASPYRAAATGHALALGSGPIDPSCQNGKNSRAINRCSGCHSYRQEEMNARRSPVARTLLMRCG